jgi:hypothetical protein
MSGHDSAEEIVSWALRLADEVVPNEVELSPSMVTAYVAGGAERDELFLRPRSVPAGFDVGVVLVVFPHVLAAIAVAGDSVWNLLGGNVSSVTTLLKNVSDLWDRRKRHTSAPTTAPASKQDFPDLGRLIDTIDTQLTAVGIESTESELMTFRIVRALIADGAGTRAFLTAVSPSAPPRTTAT